jgi:surface antigen
MPAIFRVLPSLAVAVLLTACAGKAMNTPTSTGVLALGGGLVGQLPDVSLSGEAREKALEAEFQALQFAQAGQEVAWSAGRYQGLVVPTQLYRIGSQDCRGYSQTVIARGKTVKQIGTACRGEDGLWKTVV